MRTDTRLPMGLAWMAEKKFLATLALATVGLVLLLAGGAAAKPSHCRKDCKQDISNCLALVPNNKSCTGTKVEKRACRKMYAAQRKTCRSMVSLCKQQNPSMSGTCLVSSTTTTLSTPTTTTTVTTTTGVMPTTTSTTLGSGCFTDLGDGTIHDTCTGLQWEKKDGVVGGAENAADLHDVNNSYSWAGCCNEDCSTLANYCQPNAAAAATCAAQADGGTQGCSTCASGTCNVDPLSQGALTTVWDWVNQVNAATFAGHSDWRLPSENGQNTSPSTNPRELETILLSAYPCPSSPCIDPIFGPTGAHVYWSATTWASTPGDAWDVFFANGYVFLSNKGGGRDYVRAVRTGP